MRLKLTLERQAGRRDDIVVTTDASATVGDIAVAIRRLDPRSGDNADVARTEDSALSMAVSLPGQADSIVLPPETPVGEAWLGDGATVSLVDSGRHFASRNTALSPTFATLRILTGEQNGQEYDLKPGTTLIGRDAGCDIVLGDPLVSKRHGRIEVDNGVEVIDLGSANGIVVDGGNVTRLRIARTERLLIGETEVEIAVTDAGRPGVASKPGPVPFNRSPKVENRYSGLEFQAPDVPAARDEPPFPLLAMIAPLLMGGAMYIITTNAASLIFVLLSPIMMVGNFFTAKRRERGRLRKAIAQFDERLQSLSAELTEERVRESEQRLKESPSTEDAYEAAMQRTPLLWTRRPEHWSFLNVRLGIGTMTSRNVVKTAGRGEMLREFQERLDSTIAFHRSIPDIPLIDNLYDAGALGVAGSTARSAGSLNSILVQLTALHSPAELAVAAIVTPRWSAELEWLKWIPHTSSPHSPLEGGHLADSASSGSSLLSKLEGIVDERLAASRGLIQRRGAIMQDDAALERGQGVGQSADTIGTRSPVPALVVLISDDAPVDRGRLVRLAEQAADAGVYPIWVASRVDSLPAVCRTYLELGEEDEQATVGFVRLGETIRNVTTESIDSEAALAFAKRMAPVLDAGAPIDDSSDLPRSVSTVTLLGHDLIEQGDAVVDRWRQNSSIHDRTPGATPLQRRAGKLRAIIGSAGADPMHLDLRAQGPHALVGGTTGAGKSEFLQAWVLGMAAEYSPDRVTFLFIDYKGGSAFADCVTLPHCVGLVTDLSPHLVRRALTSLRAELHYREHLLNRKKAKDLLELEKRGDPDSPPALVLVIDEFAALVGEVPEFVDGVVDIAQRGRSLGIHLIMATQRPAGVIKDNLRANTNLRVALRMADESDSQDVIGVKDAAHFDPGLPGRAVAKTGPGRLALFQSGYAGGWTSREPERAEIEVAELRFGGENRWEDSAAPAVEEQKDLGPTDQQRLVTSIIAAQRLAKIPAPRRPWLDELASAYDLGLLRQRTDAELVLGVADVPDHQEQESVYFAPDTDGHIAIYGTGGSGKSAVLRTLACAAAITPRGGPVHVYGLDFGAGSLRMLEQLPNVGSIIAGEDVERIIRLFRMLRDELDSRTARWAESNASSIADYRQLAGQPDEPRILLLIDGFSSFREDFEIQAGRSNWYDVFRDVLADGRKLGIHVALTGDRAGSIPTSVSSSIQRRVVLRLADDGYGMLDVPSDVLGPSSPPGRAIVDGLEAQIAVLGGSASVSDQSAAVGKLAEAMDRAGVTAAPAIGALPKEFPQSSLPAERDGRPVIGISDVDLGPYELDPTGTLLLAGPPASGRSTALETIAMALHRADPKARLYYCGNSRSSLSRSKLWTESATTVEAVAALTSDLAAAVADPDTTGRIAVFIESIGDFLQTAADSSIVELTKATRRSDHLLVAEAETSTWGSSWPLLGEVKNGRRGLLLQPESVEGDILLKTPLPRMLRAEFPPGRGVLVQRGTFARIQLPLPD